MMTFDQLNADARRELFGRTLQPWQWGCGNRRREFQARFKIATDDYDDLIRARVGETHVTQEVTAEMSRWAVGFFNVWKRIARKLAVAYKRKPLRRLEGASDEDNAKFARLYEKLNFDARALEWQRLCVIMNRIVVLGVARTDEHGEKTIDFDVVTGANAEVLTAPDRPIASVPDILVEQLSTQWNAGGPALRVTDSSGFRFFDAKGDEMVGMRVAQDLGTFPGADMLSAHAEVVGEWWDWRTWRAATRATVEAGLIGASMGWTRKTQCRNIIACMTNGDRDEVPDGANLTDHERPVMLNGPQIQLLVHDLDKGIDNFMKHIRALQDEIAEQMTGTVSTLVDPDPEKPSAGVGGAFQHAAIEEVRESQCPQLVRFERQMAFVIAKLATLIDDPDAVDPEMVREKFRVKFQRLPFLDTPEARVKVWAEETKFGIANQVTALVEREGISEAEAEDRLMQIAEQRVRLDAFRASRQQPGDPFADPALAGTTAMPLAAAPGETLEQTQGRAGGSFDEQGNPTSPPSADGELAPALPGAPATPHAAAKGAGKALAAQGGDVQATALNGAQVTSLLEMATTVAEGKLPLELIVNLLPVCFPGTVPDEAASARLLAPLQGFKAPPDPKLAVKPPGKQASDEPPDGDAVAPNDSAA